MFARPETLAARILVWIGAALLVVSGLVHLHLWDIAYRHVDTLGPLFVAQGVAAIAVAVVLVLWPRGLVVLAGLALAAGTILGFVKALNGGIFGFTLPVVTSWAKLALGAEIGAVVTLAAAGGLIWAGHPRPEPVPTPSPSPSGA
jgi:hypothetical protein